MYSTFPVATPRGFTITNSKKISNNNNKKLEQLNLIKRQQIYAKEMQYHLHHRPSSHITPPKKQNGNIRFSFTHFFKEYKVGTSWASVRRKFHKTLFLVDVFHFFEGQGTQRLQVMTKVYGTERHGSFSSFKKCVKKFRSC